MTRKDYIAIAGAIKQGVASAESMSREDRENHITVQELIAERVAQVMAADNPRFDVSRFLAACGV